MTDDEVKSNLHQIVKDIQDDIRAGRFYDMQARILVAVDFLKVRCNDGSIVPRQYENMRKFLSNCVCAVLIPE